MIFIVAFLSLSRPVVLGGWPAVTGRVFGDLSSRVQSLISSGRPTCPNRMDTDQTSEKMQRPGQHMTHVSY